MESKFKIGDYVCVKSKTDEIYKITSFTSIINPRPSDYMLVRDKNGDQKSFKISDMELSTDECKIMDYEKSESDMILNI